MQNKRLFLCDKEGNPAMEVGDFGVTGTYMIAHDNGGDPAWRMKCYYQAHQSNNPVAVIFPGYRMRGSGYSCKTLAQGLNELSFPTLTIEYGGTGDNKAECADPATMTTHIKDAEAALSYLTDHPHIHIPISYGVNVSMEVVNRDTRGVVGIVAAPCWIQNVISEIDMKAAAERGYVRHEMGADVKMKITEAFLRDSQNYSLFDPALRMRTTKPIIHLIAAELDVMVPPPYINRWATFMRDCGHAVDLTMIENQGHRAGKPLFFAALSEALRLRDKITHPAPGNILETPELRCI